ncbi:hypothetical protein Bca52824_040811 [Brassica carinata]|uniref:BLISTER n=1 Tax=Brassica carinata TaxID=52824 RepID=A0A8X7RU76_BRACI|nr:hypothetical protein Bca52824_040811 [Brassica carinata]
MASAQVKPSSRRQEVAEAGRRKLEQFRKQKAAKKASQSNNTTTQPVVSDSDGDVVDASIMDDFPSPSSGSTLLSTSVQMDGFMHGGGSISSTKDSLQPTTTMAGFVHEVDKNEHGSGQLRGGSSIVQKSSSYLFTSPETSSEPSDYSVNIASSSPLYSAINESSAKRNRPSFLDSLHISKAPETQYQHPGKEADLTTPSGSQLTGGDGFGLSSRQHVPRKIDSNGPSFTIMPGFTDYSMPKQNDDFSTLEQHIEDLTQEKFSLQRDLDASRALATSLASENSSMTDTYNQQVELESFRIEYANAQLECNAADERSQILAAEVISLEDKVLRLRSSELKLERELENAQAEISSYKKKLQSVEKDRQDLQSTIKALQEEKKVLQTMVQKASSGGKSTDLVKSSTSRKNASTSTEGLDTMSGSSNQETDSTALLERFSLSVPDDQMRVIDNINTLIAELAIEKEELVQALSSELSRSAHVKELNKELSRKLEVQTQRLELLTAQNMAIDNVSRPNQPDSHVVQERPPIADEGDEVVERVLGWIMKMFPGGPSKRRTSKLL